MRFMAQLQLNDCILLNNKVVDIKPKEQGRPFNMTKQQLTKFNQEKKSAFRK